MNLSLNTEWHNGLGGRAAAQLLSHELRGPVGVMIGYASMLADGTFDKVSLERRHEAAEQIMRQGHGMLSLIDAMVASLSGQDEQKMIDLRPVIKLAVERMHDRVELEAAQLSTLGLDDEEAPVFVMANQMHLLCIVTCLLNNALIYSSRPAKVVVELRSGNPAEVAVSDNGCGIEEADRPHLFELNSLLPKSTKGFGVGLALSWGLAKCNGGSLYLNWSEVGRGSTFVLALPRTDPLLTDAPEP